MKIEIENYHLSRLKLPKAGQYIIAHQNEKEVVVYQAYKPSIASFAVSNQTLGGCDYSYNRMSWIKPNFLWMMYRCGWAEKQNQERVLALWINKSVLEDLLTNAVFSSFKSQHYSSYEAWEKELISKEARLQWDPDHDPYGNKITRRALQLGLKGKLLEKFGKSQINLIEDITDYVKEQNKYVTSNQIDKLTVPIETICEFNNIALKQKIGIEEMK
jgi:Domain of unknown function (DUF4291)